MAASADPSVTSPKVKAAAVIGVLVAVVTTGVAGLGEEQFAALGIWGPLLQSLLVAGSAALAGWWKSDPLRANYVAQYNARAAQTQAEIDARFQGNNG